MSEAEGPDTLHFWQTGAITDFKLAELTACFLYLVKVVFSCGARCGIVCVRRIRGRLSVCTIEMEMQIALSNVVLCALDCG